MNKIALRIGIICEGPTDFHAITFFVGASLQEKGFDIKFVDLQPTMDRTHPAGGWTLVKTWLANNPPAQRIKRYIGGGPFESGLSAKACDVFLIQMDSDILDQESFQKYLYKEYGVSIPVLEEPSERGEYIRKTMETWSDLSSCSLDEKKFHVFVPSVESSEAWCVAASGNKHQEVERLRGQALVEAFMTALHESEGRTPQEYSTISKDVKRRKKFCQKHASFHNQIKEQCPHLARAIDELASFTS